MVKNLENAQPETWITLLEKINLFLEAIKQGKKIQESIYQNNNKPVAFEDILKPLVDFASEYLNRKINYISEILLDKAQDKIRYSLLRTLSRLFTHVFDSKFTLFCLHNQSSFERAINKKSLNPSRHLYFTFVNKCLSKGLLDILQEYPVLARLMSQQILFWIESNEELIIRIHQDIHEIKTIFSPDYELGKVVDIEFGISDRHYQGRSVSCLTFSSNLKIMYKPRNLGIEIAFFEFLDWFNQQNTDMPHLKTIKMVDKLTYGWVEFVASNACKDIASAKRYYQRAGMLLCLAYLVSGIDLHAENIIAHGEHPILIDLETLMHPYEQEVEIIAPQSAKSIAERILIDSVLSTGLLPRWQFSLLNDGYDYTGFGGGG